MMCLSLIGTKLRVGLISQSLFTERRFKGISNWPPEGPSKQLRGMNLRGGEGKDTLRTHRNERGVRLTFRFPVFTGPPRWKEPTHSLYGENVSCQQSNETVSSFVSLKRWNDVVVSSTFYDLRIIDFIRTFLNERVEIDTLNEM